MVTGSLQIKNGRYQAVLRIPDASGKDRQKWISTGIKVEGNNKRLANARLRELIVEFEQKKIDYTPDLQFTDWIRKWLEQKKDNVRLITYEAYESYVDLHIEPFFKPKNLMLRDVSPQHIQDYFNSKKRGGLSADSIKKHNVIIRGALQDAMKKNLIPYNPADRATLPATTRFIGKAYTSEQANTLLHVINDEPLKPAIILGLFYGLRRSETLGLRWRDIDFDAGTITIRNTVVRMKTMVEAEQTKSRASKRTMFIIPETRDYLLGLKKAQAERQDMMGSSYVGGDKVCVWDDGRPFLPDYVTHRFVKILKNNDLPRIRYHELRHTAGSLLLAKGLSAKQIQEYLGHEKVSTTLDIYD